MKLETFSLKTRKIEKSEKPVPSKYGYHGNIKCQKFQENVKTLVAFKVFG